jgi:hypothetical protein
MRLTTPFVWEEYHRESYMAECPLGTFYMEPATNFLDDIEKEWYVFALTGDENIGTVKSMEHASQLAENWLFETIRKSVVFETRDT